MMVERSTGRTLRPTRTHHQRKEAVIDHAHRRAQPPVRQAMFEASITPEADIISTEAEVMTMEAEDEA